MTPRENIAKPLARAINIYSRVARRDLDNAVRRGLARHIKRLAEQGIADSDRLTVCGLSYLRSHESQPPHPPSSSTSRSKGRSQRQ
jgi:hypothetical protein